MEHSLKETYLEWQRIAPRVRSFAIALTGDVQRGADLTEAAYEAIILGKRPWRDKELVTHACWCVKSCLLYTSPSPRD